MFPPAAPDLLLVGFAARPNCLREANHLIMAAISTQYMDRTMFMQMVKVGGPGPGLTCVWVQSCHAFHTHLVKYLNHGSTQTWISTRHTTLRSFGCALRVKAGLALPWKHSTPTLDMPHGLQVTCMRLHLLGNGVCPEQKVCFRCLGAGKPRWTLHDAEFAALCAVIMSSPIYNLITVKKRMS